MIGAAATARQALRVCGGFWRYMAERVHARKEVELERARNEATAAVVPLLRPGTDFLEYEPNGRMRIIRTPALPPSGSSVSTRLGRDETTS